MQLGKEAKEVQTSIVENLPESGKLEVFCRRGFNFTDIIIISSSYAIDKGKKPQISQFSFIRISLMEFCKSQIILISLSILSEKRKIAQFDEFFYIDDGLIARCSAKNKLICSTVIICHQSTWRFVQSTKQTSALLGSVSEFCG